MSTPQGDRYAHRHRADLDSLPAPTRRVLEDAAVIGQRFTSPVLRKLTGLEAPELRVELDRLVVRGYIFRRPFGDEYEFQHQFKHAAIYDAIPTSRRKEVHAAVTTALIALHPNIDDVDPSDLAYHMERSGQIEEAIEQLERAGRLHVTRWALKESIDDYDQALRLNDELDRADKRPRELALRLSRGGPLMAKYGYAAPELLRNYQRAEKLADDPGTSADRKFEVQRVLWVVAHTCGEADRAEQVGRLCAKLVESELDPVTDPGYRVERYLIQGFTAAHRGRYAEADAYFTEATSGRDDLKYPADKKSIVRYTQDPLVLCLTHHGWVRWMLGYPDQAVAKAREAVARAEELDHGHSRAIALIYAAWMHHLRDEPEQVESFAVPAEELARRCGLRFWRIEACLLLGWSKCARGRLEEGIEEMTQAAKDWKDIGCKILLPYYLALIAEARARRTRIGWDGSQEKDPEGSDLEIRDLLECAIAYQEDIMYPQILFMSTQIRIDGPLAQVLGEEDLRAAEHDLRQALGVAQSQEVKSIELRIATSLGRLLAARGRTEEGRSLLRPLYNWFTEGHDTHNLKAARLFLDGEPE